MFGLLEGKGYDVGLDTARMDLDDEDIFAALEPFSSNLNKELQIAKVLIRRCLLFYTLYGAYL